MSSADAKTTSFTLEPCPSRKALGKRKMEYYPDGRPKTPDFESVLACYEIMKHKKFDNYNKEPCVFESTNEENESSSDSSIFYNDELLQCEAIFKPQMKRLRKVQSEAVNHETETVNNDEFEEGGWKRVPTLVDEIRLADIREFV